MGFLISINGADFHPYDLPPLVSERIPKAPSAVKVHAIGEETPATFQEALGHTQKAAEGPYQKQIEKEKRVEKKAVWAKDIMTAPVFSLKQEESLEEASFLISEKKFHHVPIVDNQNRLMGILSDRDLLKFRGDPQTEISEIMTKKVIAATPDTLLREVARALRDHRIHSLPIIDEAHELLGIITTTDILDALLKRVDLHLWA